MAKATKKTSKSGNQDPAQTSPEIQPVSIVVPGAAGEENIQVESTSVPLLDSPDQENLSPDQGQPANATPDTQQADKVAGGDIPDRPEITQELAKAKFNTELARLKYEEAYNRFVNFKITEENMAQAQEMMKKARTFLRNFETIKTRLKAPAWKECTIWDNTFNSLKTPLEQAISNKQVELNKIASDQAKKKEAAQKEEDRKTGIRTAINNFILEQSQAIAVATKPEQLVAIEKLIGSHKANKARYEEFLPDLATRCEDLTTLIKNQKETIKQLVTLEENLQKADQSGDDQKFIALTEQKEKLEAKLDENKILVQETAIEQVTKPTGNSGGVVIGIPVHKTIAARRTAWKAELVKVPGTEELDKKELANAFKAGMLKCELDPDKVKASIETLKGAGSLKDKTELIVNGVRYYEEKLY